MSEEKHLEALHDIRKIMDRSTRFLSLSGLSGIAAGIIALIGTSIGYIILTEYVILHNDLSIHRWSETEDFIQKLVITAICTLSSALLAALYFTYRKAQKLGNRMWDRSSKRLLINLIIPLFIGGVFCLSLIWNNLFYLVPSATLIFYGLGLINSSKYTLPEIQTLGIFQTTLGLGGCFLPEYSFLLWGAGFGLLHIIYGSVMYFKYERQTK